MDIRAQETSGPSQDGKPVGVEKPRRWKGVFAAGLYLALLAAGVFLADQVHVWWVLRKAPATLSARPTAVAGQWRASQPASQDSGLEGILALNGPSAGMARFDGNPGDLPPPPDALRRWAFQRSSGDMEQYARYDFPGSLEQAGDYYLRLLQSRGYHLASDQSQDAAKRLLVFASPLAKVVEINLHKRPRPADSVDIGLRVRQASPAAYGVGVGTSVGPDAGLHVESP